MPASFFLRDLIPASFYYRKVRYIAVEIINRDLFRFKIFTANVPLLRRNSIAGRAANKHKINGISIVATFRQYNIMCVQPSFNGTANLAAQLLNHLFIAGNSFLLLGTTPKQSTNYH